MELLLQTALLTIVAGVGLVLGCNCVRGRRGGQRPTNPFEVGGLAGWCVPVVKLLHSCEVAVCGGTAAAAGGRRLGGGGRAPVGFVFRLLNRADRCSLWLCGRHLVPVQTDEFGRLAASLHKLADNDNTAAAVRLYLQELDRRPMSATGRLTVQHWVMRMLSTRQHVVEYVKANPRIQKVLSHLPHPSRSSHFRLLVSGS